MVEKREKKEFKIGTNGILSLRLGDGVCFPRDNTPYKVLASDSNEYRKS